MYILTQEETRNYIQTLLYIAKIDGEKTARELEAIYCIAEDLGLETPNKTIPHLLKELEDGKELRPILANFTRRSLKINLLYELCVLCFADGECSDEEIDALHRICALIGIDFDKLEEIITLVKDYQKLDQRAEEILEWNTSDNDSIS